MPSLLQAQWLVKPLKTPRPSLSCARCDAKRAFVCSEKFRVNAHKRRVDAWLIYRCEHCDQTWNLPVLERCPVQGIAPALLNMLMGNDSGLARRHAFDLARLRRHAQQVETFPELSVEKSAKTVPCGNPERAEVELCIPFECGCRLDKLLAGELGVSRGQVGRLIEAGAMTVMPASARAWRQDARNGQLVAIDLGAMPDEQGMLRRIVGD
jgi:hypothetical protein